MVRSASVPDKGTEAASSTNSTVLEGFYVHLSIGRKVSFLMGKEVSDPFKNAAGRLPSCLHFLGPKRDEFLATFQNHTQALDARATARRSVMSDPKPRSRYPDKEKEEDGNNEEEEEK